MEIRYYAKSIDTLSYEVSCSKDRNDNYQIQFVQYKKINNIEVGKMVTIKENYFLNINLSLDYNQKSFEEFITNKIKEIFNEEPFDIKLVIHECSNHFFNYKNYFVEFNRYNANIIQTDAKYPTIYNFFPNKPLTKENIIEVIESFNK